MSKQQLESVALGRLLSGDIVSVILPINSDWLANKRSLESIYQQSYQPIELILLDNSPDDSCLDKVRLWLTENDAGKRFYKVVIEQCQQQLEPYHVINKGLALAEGKALTILSAGDRYIPKRIEILMQAAENQHADWLFSSLQVDDASGARAYTDLAIDIEASIDCAHYYPTVGFALLKKNIVVTPGNLFFSAVLYKRVGEFRPMLHGYHWDFALQACLISEPVLIDQPLYRYQIQTNETERLQTTAQSLEYKIACRRYFSACRAGHCINPEAPWFNNWPEMFGRWIEADAVLSQMYDQVGQSVVKYDNLANTIGFNN